MSISIPMSTKVLRCRAAQAGAAPAAVASLALLSAGLFAQGPFVNYEVGAVQPIALQTFAVGNLSRTVLFVCNTADDALELYDAVTRARIARVPTGLAPVTVRWDPITSRAYTCNFVGDSVTCVDVTATTGGGAVQVGARLAATFAVGDEPSDIAFVPGGTAGSRQAVVSLRSRSGLAHVDLVARQVIDGRFSPAARIAAVNQDWGVKNPRNMQFVGADRFYLLDHQSGLDNSDIDLFVARSSAGGIDIVKNPTVEHTLHDLGTTHANFVINAAGDRMYVVGMRSTPSLSDNEVTVGDLPTGFTQSWLWVVDLNPSTAVPTTRPESAGPFSVQPSINLNRNYANAGTGGPLLAVAPVDALAQPTGLALVESNGTLSRIVVTAFSSDAVAVLTPNQASMSGWQIQRLNLTPRSGYGMAGPRAVVVNASGTTAYVMCSLDNSVRVINIAGATPTLAATLPLADDTPLAIRSGREFLYGAKHSGSGTVSCSSCHIDGHTDALTWTLNQGHQGFLPPGFINGPTPIDWVGQKGPMVTQTLRGLVNHDVEGAAQSMFTNAPYHWRGDRADFQAFNGAFVDLLSRTGGQLSAADINKFTDFVETILHGPNPEQPITRILTGSMGDAADPERAWNPTKGSGMKRGLKLFHASDMTATCAHCHVLPEGSGNRATQLFTFNLQDSPIEPAALRHLFDREAHLQIGLAIPAAPVRLKLEGMSHDGATPNLFPSISHFIQNRFAGNMPGPSAAERDQQILDLTAFVRGLDSGSAPIIGVAYTCTGTQLDDDRVLQILLGQVREANAGLVAHVVVANTVASHWYDLTQDRFRNDATLQTLTPSALLALATGSNVIVLQAVPVGSERRIADYSGANAVDNGPPLANVTLEPMALPTHWQEGGDLRARWAKGIGPYQLTSLAPRESHHRQLFMQVQLIRAAGAPTFTDFGINNLDLHRKHELPRRFRVAGDNLLPGAMLELMLPRSTGAPQLLRMPLFPTNRLNGSGHRIWETTVEVDGEMMLALLCGGPFRDNVRELLDFTGPLVVNPAADNIYAWTVRNGNGASVSGMAPLRVQHSR